MPRTKTDVSAAAERLFTIADPNRLAVLMSLTTGALKTTDLSRMSGVDQPGLTRHLSKLKEAKLVVATREGKGVRYSLATEGINVTATTLEFVHASGARASFSARVSGA